MAVLSHKATITIFSFTGAAFSSFRTINNIKMAASDEEEDTHEHIARVLRECANMDVIPVHTLMKSFTMPEHMPRSFAEQCVLLLTRALSANKQPKVLVHIFKSINHDARHHYRSSLHTLDGAFMRMRKVVLLALQNNRDHPLYLLAQKELNVSSAQRRLLREEYLRRIEQTNNHVFCFEEATIKQTLHTLRDSADIHDTILLLMLESGLRMIEVLCTATIAQTEVHTRAMCDWVSVKGLAKTRQKDRQVIKPLLTLSFDAFMARLALVRTTVQAKTAAEVVPISAPVSPPLSPRANQLKAVTNLFNHAVNMRVHVHLGPHTSHIARKIYGALSYEWYGKLRGQSLNAWLQSVMGHTAMSTTLSYSNVRITQSPDAAEGDNADIAFFAKPGSHPIDLDQMLALVGDQSARASWLRLMTRNFRRDGDYKMADSGCVRMTVWCAINLLERSGRPRALDVMHRVRNALLTGLCPKLD